MLTATRAHPQLAGAEIEFRMPWLNHCWQVTLYPTAWGLTTARMPYGEESFEIEFNSLPEGIIALAARRSAVLYDPRRKLPEKPTMIVIAISS